MTGPNDNPYIDNRKRKSADSPPVNDILKSKKAKYPSFIKFKNNTGRTVDVVWLNFEGKRVKYTTLEPTRWVDVNTYAGHPWIVRDSASGDKLLVQLKEVYDPVAWSREVDGWPPRRKEVQITLPVYSLTERCVQIIRKQVNRNNFHQLDIPRELIDHLLSQEAPNIQEPVGGI